MCGAATRAYTRYDQGGPTLRAQGHVWTDRHSKFDETNDRASAETELLALAPTVPTTVLNLCGLWGGPRQPRNWVSRVAPTKEALKQKVRAILLLHPKVSLRR